MARLVLRKLTMRFESDSKTTLALDDFSLNVEQGELVTVVGPSGCGKTTLFNIIAGFIAPTTGEVELDGAPITEPTPRIGVVFQEHALFPWLTVERNVSFGPRMIGLKASEYRQRVDGLIRLVGLTDFADVYPVHLSGGMRQRVALARSLANQPDVLLMDEPFGALDAQTREILQRELIRIWQETGTTIVFVTHSIEESVLLSDRVVALTARPGRIKDILSIDLGRPRAVVSAAFRQHQARIQDLLAVEIQQAQTSGALLTHVNGPERRIAR